MKCLRHHFFDRVLAAVITVLLCALRVPCRAEPAEARKMPILTAHYMPWFAAKPASWRWGWHWTMNAFDPEQRINGRRSIASHYYPLIGPYDSGDAAVIEYHLLLMKLAGIDGIFVDWYGLSDFLDYPAIHRNTQRLFASAAKLGLRVGICYEDQTITKQVAAKRIAAGDRIKYAQREIAWLRENWFLRPAYLRLNGKPVLLSFGQDGLSDSEWEAVLDSTASPLYLSEHRRRSAASGTFDWVQPQRGLSSLDRYYASVKDQPLFLPAAFPRFHDIYREGRAQAGYPQIPDDQGRTFSMTLERALNSGAPMIQIATWNDWGEGTGIEPTAEFGYRDLETIQKCRRNRDSHWIVAPADLRLPYRLWRLRGRQAQQPQITPELDAIAVSLASGRTNAARFALARLENLSQRSR